MGKREIPLSELAHILIVVFLIQMIFSRSLHSQTKIFLGEKNEGNNPRLDKFPLQNTSQSDLTLHYSPITQKFGSASITLRGIKNDVNLIHSTLLQDSQN